MKYTYKFLLSIALIFSIVSCDYLDIVPDERPTDKDAMEDFEAARRYLYSCYSYLPRPNNLSDSMELLTADELVSTTDNFKFFTFMKGNYTPSNPVLSHWTQFYNGIRQCYLFLSNIDRVPNWPSESMKLDYESQGKFLIAYYHYRLCREYGPIIVLDEIGDLGTPVHQYKARSSYDDCVEFICRTFEEAANGLPATRSGRDYGLVTSTAAYALIGKMRLFAASPLYNGNSEYYADFKDANGNPLISTNYDPQKWEIAKQTIKRAIDFARSNGYDLYKNTKYNEGNLEPLDPTQHCLRNIMIEAGNQEIIMSDSRSEYYWDVTNASLPYATRVAFSSQGPTLTMLDRFYTKNGLPIDVDPDFDLEGKHDIVTVGEAYSDIAEVGQKTLKMNLDREPRFYAWVGFQGGFYELKSEGSGEYSKDPSYKKYSNGEKSKLVCNFLIGGNCARGKTVSSIRSSDYTMSCYLNKKGVNPAYAISNSVRKPLHYPWALLRLADLYLCYAESCVETNDLDEAKKYLNYVRERAGIPAVEKSWEQIAGKPLTKDLLRDIVRQERLIELYFEGHQFWDVRRWKIAEKYIGLRGKGFNTKAKTMEEFVELYEIPFERKFTSPKNYLMPIPQDEINKNPNLIQNIGYDTAEE